MRVCEVKDFLVQQTVEQAALENVPLSDLEKRMMYFTEDSEMSEDPLELNNGFDAEYDSEEYEAKVSKLMRRAFWRAKKENPESARQWGVALKKLAAGDHYLSALWEVGSKERPPHDSLKLLGTALLVIVVGAALMFGYSALAGHFAIHWNSGPKTYGSLPVWLQRSVLAAIVGGYFYSVLLLWISKRPAVGIVQLIAKLLHHKSKK